MARAINGPCLDASHELLQSAEKPLLIRVFLRAGDQIRTGDPHLGKVTPTSQEKASDSRRRCDRRVRRACGTKGPEPINVRPTSAQLSIEPKDGAPLGGGAVSFGRLRGRVCAFDAGHCESMGRCFPAAVTAALRWVHVWTSRRYIAPPLGHRGERRLPSYHEQVAEWDRGSEAPDAAARARTDLRPRA